MGLVKGIIYLTPLSIRAQPESRKTVEARHETLRACDGFSDVRYTVTAEGGKLIVAGVDTSDGGRAQEAASTLHRE